MSGRLSAAVLATTLLLARHGAPASPSAAAPPPQTTPAADPVSALQLRVAALVSDPSVAAGTWGVSVRTLATNESLVAINDTRLLTPASTLKLFTLAAAADQLGWDFTFETRVLMTGTVHDGTLDGDLVVVGSGDPSLDDWDGAATALFRTWADRLRERGVRTIAGRIVGDDRAFPDAGLGSGWAWDDLAFSYSARAGALQFNQNSARILAAPALSAALPAVVTLTPPFANVPLKVNVSTGPPRATPVLLVAPRPRDSVVEVTGTVPLRSGPLARTIAVSNPTAYYVRAVREGLRAAGIDVRGNAVDIGDLTAPPDLEGASPVLVHRSPTLASLADTMMKLSQNLYAETLLRTLGAVRGGTATTEAGLDVERMVLDTWGIQPSEALVVDGSGLSRYNLVTTRAMATLLARVYADHRLRDPFVASLNLAGRSGTLAQRMRGTRAEANAAAKTGSFSNARGVGGFVTSADGEVVAFAIVANNYGVSPDTVDRVTDAIIVSLASFSRHAAR